MKDALNKARSVLIGMMMLFSCIIAQAQTYGQFQYQGHNGYAYGYINQPPPPVVYVDPVPRYVPYNPYPSGGYIHPHQRERIRCIDDYRHRCYAQRHRGSTYSCDVPPVSVRQQCMR